MGNDLKALEGYSLEECAQFEVEQQTISVK